MQRSIIMSISIVIIIIILWAFTLWQAGANWKERALRPTQLFALQARRKKLYRITAIGFQSSQQPAVWWVPRDYRTYRVAPVCAAPGDPPSTSLAEAAKQSSKGAVVEATSCVFGSQSPKEHALLWMMCFLTTLSVMSSSLSQFNFGCTHAPQQVLSPCITSL